MAVHTGSRYSTQEVSIGPPDLGSLLRVPKSPDVLDAVHWFADAQERKDIYYFSVYRESELVGQILLHDMDSNTGESLVAYHLFDPKHRGRGIGTKALGLLQQFVVKNTGLTKLVIITSRDNLASQGVATKCGFVRVGAPREDPENGLFFS